MWLFTQIKQYYQEHKGKFIFIIIVIAIFGICFSYYSVELTSTTEFCVLCHEMDHSLVTLKESTHYKDENGKTIATCRDCHLPSWRHPVRLILAKIYHGTKDVYHHYTDQEEMKYPYYLYEMKMKARKSVPSSSCIECHTDVMESKSPDLKMFHKDLIQNKQLHCVDCHKNLVHKPL